MKVFISYRREDSAGHAGRLHDSLQSRFGADNVFNTHPDKASAALNNDNNGTFPYSVFSPFGFNGAYVYGKAAYRW